MKIDGWKYYNHAAIPISEPHETVDIKCILDNTIWKIDGGKPLFARWTTDFDCGEETEWWYVIKDVPFDISELKSKRRYEINKGKKFFDVKIIDPQEYITKLLDVTIEAVSSWPEKYRPFINEEILKKQVQGWGRAKIYGAFSKEANELCGYAVLEQHSGHLAFSILRVNPKCEKQGINAAIVSFLLEDNSENLNGNYYISDGARSIRHETAFQDYLEKYFGFRKAYCKLHIKYRGIMSIVVKTFYPLRKMIKGNGKLSSLILGVLKMEEIRRSFN